MIKTMSAKKLCALALVCLCVMLASPVLAGDPVGPVGPRIKGLQVGMPITPSEMVDLACVLFRGVDFEINVRIDNSWGGGPHSNKYTLNFTWAGEQLKSWDIIGGEIREKKIGQKEETLKEKLFRYKTFSEVFDALLKEHKKYGDDYHFSILELRLTPFGFNPFEMTMNAKKGILRNFKLPSFVFFDTKNMSLEDFTQAIYDAYELPDLYSEGSAMYAVTKREEGWMLSVVQLDEKFDNYGFNYYVGLDMLYILK